MSATIFNQTTRGDIITDCIGEQFLVLAKTKHTLIVSDLQDNGFVINIPEAFADELGVSINNGGYEQHPHYQQILDQHPEEKYTS